MKVYAFDRDSTVDVNPPEGKEAVPLEWVTYLARETDHEVWAIGNQALAEEAGLPGDPEALELYEERWGDPHEQIERRNARHLEEWVDPPPDAPDPDLVNALVEWKEEGTRPARHQRVRLVGSLFPDAEEYVVVDNRYLGYIDGWTYRYPWEFVRTVRENGGIESLRG